jgi:hypothetical protein
LRRSDEPLPALFATATFLKLPSSFHSFTLQSGVILTTLAICRGLGCGASLLRRFGASLLDMPVIRRRRWWV